TGSQVTKVSVFTNEATHTKSAICHPNVFAKVGIVDPELMASMPPRLTAATGFDAFTHAFESYININSNIFIDAIAIEAISVVAKYLKTAVKEGGNMEARAKMAYADTLAGMTIANVGTTLPHAMGQPVSGHAPHVSHGEALALVYPEFLRFTYASSAEKFAKVARIFDPSLAGESDEKAAGALSSIIVGFQKDIGLSLTLKTLGVDPKLIESILDDCMDFPDMYVNPAVPTREELRQMFTNMAE
ncbi:MAG: iron-containing alcohol dehydrogenase, partial [Defluviitaleaceae bacterium]|nr:iron-containing alcohol dehydrogenase [Defluviitaleaceae bacterium]